VRGKVLISGFALLVGSLAAAHPLPRPNAGWSGGLAPARTAAQAVMSGALVLEPRPLAGVRELDGRAARGQHLVAFTFDDGPHPATTGRVLDTLKKAGIPATFFVVGWHLEGPHGEAAAALIQRAQREGHYIGNHTFRHDRLVTASRAQAWRSIGHAESLIGPLLAHGRTTLFRPPYGKLSPQAQALLADLDYTIVGWSIDVHDFTHSSPEAITGAVLDQLFADEGGVVLLHDTLPETVVALPRILDGLRRENCRRLARGGEPIVPVPLDLIPVPGGRPLTPDQQSRLEEARARVASRCVSRTRH
jgi:peptidoglycan/xylan/chitin deacetylase (PgdA/CDA1 family)